MEKLHYRSILVIKTLSNQGFAYEVPGLNRELIYGSDLVIRKTSWRFGKAGMILTRLFCLKDRLRAPNRTLTEEEFREACHYADTVVEHSDITKDSRYIKKPSNSLPLFVE